MLTPEEGQKRAARARAGKGRPLGSCNLGSKQLSGLAKSFKAHGFDWRGDFASACQKKNWKLMQFYLKLLPFMTTQNPGYRKNNGNVSKTKPSRTQALTQLDAQEQAARARLSPLPLGGGEDYTSEDHI